jgi:hypothetical protein
MRTGELRCIYYLFIDGNGSLFAETLRACDAIVVSDGSYIDHYGKAALVLEGSDSIGRIISMSAREWT